MKTLYLNGFQLTNIIIDTIIKYNPCLVELEFLDGNFTFTFDHYARLLHNLLFIETICIVDYEDEPRYAFKYEKYSNNTDSAANDDDTPSLSLYGVYNDNIYDGDVDIPKFFKDANLQSSIKSLWML